MLLTGWDSVDFTPSRPAIIHGQIYTRIGYEAADPITFNALAVQDETSKEAAILISGDLCEGFDNLLHATRERVVRRLPHLNPSSIIMFSTHTHDSLALEPQWYPYPGGDVMTADECLIWAADKAAEAATNAWRKLAPTSIANALGTAVVAHSRRPVYASGEAQMYGSANRPDFREIEGPSNHYLDMLFAWDKNEKLVGIILVVPCPSQVDEDLDMFSADFWHEIRAGLRQHLGRGLQIVGLCGAGGDQSPHLIINAKAEEEMRRRRGLTERQEIARRVVNEVLSALECTNPRMVKESKFAHNCDKMSVTPRTITQKEHAWAAAESANASKTLSADSWWPTMLRHVAAEYEGKYKTPPMPIEIHALRFGDLAIVTNPFELYVDYAFQIMGRSTAPHTSVAQLSCGNGLYLPTARGAANGSYGAMPAVAPIGPEGGQEVVEASLALIDSLYSNENA